MRYIFRGPSSSGEGAKANGPIPMTPPDESRAQAMQAQTLQDEFQRTILADASEVAGKAISSSNSQIRQILVEVVEQSGQFWSVQLNKAAVANHAALQDMRHQLAIAQEGAAEAARRHVEESTDLRQQLDTAQDALASTQAGHVREVARLQERIRGSEATLEEATRTYKGLLQDLNRQVHSANESAHDAGLKAQQRKMVMLQTSEAQRREIDELKASLEQEKAHSAALDERAKKLTQLSQHLLAKQSKSVAAATAAAAAQATPPRRSTTAGSPTGAPGLPTAASPGALPPAGTAAAPLTVGPSDMQSSAGSATGLATTPTATTPTGAALGLLSPSSHMDEAAVLDAMSMLRGGTGAGTPPAPSAAGTPPLSPHAGADETAHPPAAAPAHAHGRDPLADLMNM